MEETILSSLGKILEGGLLGALLVLMGVAYYLKDKKISFLRDEIQKIQNKRIEDAKASKIEVLAITKEVSNVVDQLTKLVKMD